MKQKKWITAWEFEPLNMTDEPVIVENTTHKVTIYNNLNGTSVRVRLSNRHGQAPAVIDSLRIHLEHHEKCAASSVEKAVTLNGQTVIVLAPGEECFSDPIDVKVSAGDLITVICLFKERQTITTLSMTVSSLMWWSEIEGESKGEDTVSQALLFNAIQVQTKDEVRVISMFGDSITNMDRYTGALAEDLYRRFPGEVSLINCGISGNRMLFDPLIMEGRPRLMFGQAALTRFEKDVFEGGTSPSDVCIMIGVNDLMHGPQLNIKEQFVDASMLEEGALKLIRICKKHGANVYLCTITPFAVDDAPDWFKTMDAERVLFNAWVMRQTESDGVIDIASAVCDPFSPNFYREENDSGDGLHPSAEGGRVMALAAERVLLGIDS